MGEKINNTIEIPIVNQLKEKFFKKTNDKVYYNDSHVRSIYLIYKPSFDDIESLKKHMSDDIKYIVNEKG